MPSLEDSINSPANLEMKRALAVKMILFDFKTEEICALLKVSHAFVSKGKIIFENEGAGALNVSDTGGNGCLPEAQREELIFYLRLQPHSSVAAWREYLDTPYGVVYQSKQSYYDLLAAGGLSWHQTQAHNRNRDEPPGWRRREERKKN